MRHNNLPLMLVILLTAAVLRLSGLEVYPPGPHYDEGAELLIARSIAFGGANLFPIANSYQGRETLYHYLNVPLLRTIHDSIFTLQVSSVYMNLLTIAASMALGRLMLRGRRGVLVGLAVGVMMTISFHQIYISRQAFRSVALPMCQALGLLFLWRGLRAGRGGWGWLVAGGVCSAAALYTYMASRLFPIWLGMGGVVLLLADGARRGQRLRQGAVFFAALGIAAVPMVRFALENPDIFWGRLAEVTNTGTDISLAESVRLHLRMFFIEGEAYVRYNAPGRPYLTLPEGLFLLTGLGISAWRVLRGAAQPTERAAYFLALLAPLMVIPSVISVGGLPPNHMRSLGMVPLIFVLAAVGVEFWAAPVAEWLLRRWPALARPACAAALASGAVCLPLALGSALVYRDYMVWAGRVDVFYQADGDLAAAAAWLPAHVDANTLVYVASYHREHPTVITGWPGAVTWLGTDSLVLPPPEKTGIVIFAHDLAPAPGWFAGVPAQAFTDIPAGPDGEPAFSAYRVDGAALPAPPVTDVHNALLTLISIDGAAVESGGRADLTMRWRIDQAPPYDRLRPILALHDPNGTLLAERDAFLLGTTRWRPGEVMIQQMALDVPLGTPPGRYPLMMTWTDRDSGTYLTYQNEEGAFAGVTVEIGHLEVVRPQMPPPADALAIPVRQSVDLAPGIRLLGWSPAAAALRPGEAARVTAFWEAIPADDGRASARVRAVLRAEPGADVPGETVLWEGRPLEMRYLVTEWRAGDVLTEHLRWALPREQPAGRYHLVLQGELGEATLGSLEVAALVRLLEPPPVDVPLDARFGEALTLVGYRVLPGEHPAVALVWRAEAAVEKAYTVFVHVVDATGMQRAQRDWMPMQNSYPTSLWLPGEYVVDEYRFDELPPGVYGFRIGLYLQTNGERLTVLSVGGSVLPRPLDYVQVDP